MRDTLKIECLVHAFQEVIEAKREHDKARSEYTGYSWGYHGYRYVQDMEKAAEQFQTTLDEYISDKVKSAVRSLMEPPA